MPHGRYRPLTKIALLLWLCACDKEGEPAPEPSPVRAPMAAPAVERSQSDTHVVYVPAYSHIFAGGNRRIMLSITLSVRNLDQHESVTVRHVDYYDTPGHLVRRYLSAPQVLPPLGTLEYSVGLFDDSGGSGANFLVGWDGVSGTAPLLAEAVMLGQTSSGSIAFVSRGVSVDEAPAPRVEGKDRPAPDAASSADASTANEP